MRRVGISVLAVACVLAVGACRRDAEPPPKAFSHGDLGVIPVRTSDIVVDNAMLGAAATSDESSRSTAATPAAEAVKIDDSTPEGLAQGYATVMSTLQLRQLPELVIPEQVQQATEMVQAAQPVLEAAAELTKALKERFPDEKFQISPANLSAGIAITPGTPEVDPADPNIVTVIFQAEGLPDMKQTLRKIDEHWKIDVPSLPSAEQLAQAQPLFEKVMEALKGLTTRLQSGDFADAATFRMEYETAMKQAASDAAAGVTVTPSENPEPSEPPTDGGPKPPPSPRPKSELEQDVDGAVSGPLLQRR